MAERSLLDTLTVAAAQARDLDDLHTESTTHIHAVCVAATLACGGGPRKFLALAGMTARLSAAPGWPHYT